MSSTVPRTRIAFVVSAFALAMGSASCTDPVRDQQIEALGGEDPGVPMGPEHRPGQPCVLCHSKGGPAEKAPFVIAGTIYETGRSEIGQPGVAVSFVDSVGGRRIADTNAAGNFFITESDWRDLAFPFKVAVQQGANTKEMSTTVNREGSCAFCHKRDSSYDAITQVYTGAP